MRWPNRTPQKENIFTTGGAAENERASSDEVVELDTESVVATGPQCPAAARPPARPALVIPSQIGSSPDATAGPVVQVCGLHGGAGTSTVGAVLGPVGLDCGIGLEAAPHLRAAPVLLVARTHGRGLDLALRAAQQWSSGQLDGMALLGLVLVDDGPSLGQDLGLLVASVQHSMPHTWRLRWDENWRHDPLPPETSRLPARVRRVSKSITEHARAVMPDVTTERKTS